MTSIRSSPSPTSATASPSRPRQASPSPSRAPSPRRCRRPPTTSSPGHGPPRRPIAARRGRAVPAVAVHLEKNLPVASGIGGGSANAAAALRGFLSLAGIDEIDDEVIAAGLAIGADVPVCLAGRGLPHAGRGRAHHAARRISRRSPPSSSTRWSRCQHRQSSPPSASARASPMAQPSPTRAIPPGGATTSPHPPSPRPRHRRGAARLAATPGVTRAFMSGSGATCVALLADDAATPDLDPHWWSARTVLG